MAKRLPPNPEWVQILDAITKAEDDYERWWKRMSRAFNEMTKARNRLKALRKRADGVKEK